MSVRAKFRVESTTKYRGGYNQVKLSPVTSGSPENEAFFKQTPGGSIDISTINDEAAVQFEVGAEFYVDFTKAG